MSEGHSGTSNAEVNRASQNPFELVLSYLIDPGGAKGTFVLHVSSNVSYSFGMQPTDLLAAAGLRHFQGQCPFFGGNCWFRELAHVRRDHDGERYMERRHEIQQIHAGFKAFAQEIPQLHNLVHQQEQILARIGSSTGGIPIFATAPILDLDDSTEPAWVEAIKFPALAKLEDEIAGLKADAEDLRRYLPLLYASGDALEAAVLQALILLGLRAELTEPGFTADILAQTPDGEMRFGVEVTGIVGSVKKQSPKLTQVLDFERVKEHGEKTILIAGTHRNISPDAREELDDFTGEVVGFLGRHPILLMTTLDLYRMIGDVISKEADPAAFVQTMYESEGPYSRSGH